MTILQIVRKIQIAAEVEGIVSRDSQRCRQFNLATLRNIVQEHISGTIEPGEMVEVLKFLWRNGRISLTKPDWFRLHAIAYSGIESDGWFFHTFNFNVAIRGN